MKCIPIKYVLYGACCAVYILCIVLIRGMRAVYCICMLTALGLVVPGLDKPETIN